MSYHIFYRFPFVHVMVHNADDIRAAITFARDHNLRVTIKSSGHDFWGRSSAHSSFSINLMEMKEMLVTTDRTDRSEHGELKVETGATWREIYQKVCFSFYECLFIGLCTGYKRIRQFTLPAETVRCIWLPPRLSAISCFLPRLLCLVNSFLQKLSV